MLHKNLPGFKACLLASVIAGLTGCYDDVIGHGDNNKNIVTDKESANALSITVSGVNVDEGTSGEVTGSANIAATYTWEQTAGPSAIILQSDTDTLRFEAPRVTEDTVLTFNVTATDGTKSATSSVEVTVLNVAAAPTANAGNDKTVTELTADVALSGSASVAFDDQPSDSFTYTWRKISGPDITLSSTSEANPTFTAPSVDADTEVKFGLIVSNSEGESTEDVVAITIANLLPVAEAGTTIDVVEGQTFSLDGSASAPAGANPLNSYTWRAVGNSIEIPAADATSALRDGLVAPRVDGGTPVEYQFGLIVSDGTDQSVEDLVTVRVADGGAVPTLSVANIEGQQNTVLTLDASASSDPDGRALTFNWTQVLADGETAVVLTANGATASFTAPAVDADTLLTFEVTADNGLNTSAASTVDVLVKAKQTYNGKVVQLHGNPFTTLYASLDLSQYGDLYDLVVDGDLAYATYHDRDTDGTPTGLLVIDISDEKDLKVAKHFPVAFYGGKGVSDVQLNVEVDSVAGYAYVVDQYLVDTNETVTSLARINLNADPTADGYFERYADVEIEGEKIGKVSDLVLRNGSLYLSTIGDRSILKLDLTSAPATPTITQVWQDDPTSDLDTSIKDPSRSRSQYDGTQYERLEIADDGEGAVAVLYNGSFMQVVRLDAADAVTEFYSVRSSGTELDSSSTVLDYRIFNGVMDKNNIPAMSFAFDESGDYIYVSFAEDTDANRPLRPFSALEKIDIRSPSSTTVDTAGVYFQTTEDAYEVVRSGGVTYLAGGIQGLQLIENVDGVDAGADSMQVKTYYQTPQRAEDIVIAQNSASLPRAYVTGDRTFTIIDLDPARQAAPAKSTRWVSEYVSGTEINPDKSASGHKTEGNKRGQASDVEIVAQYNDDGVIISEYAVVVESADPDAASDAESENKLVIFDITDETFSGTEVTLGSVDTGYGQPENYADIRLHQAYGDIYIYDPAGDPGSNLRLAREQVTRDTPAVRSANFGFNVSAFEFSADNEMVVSGDNNIAFWQWDDGDARAVERDVDDIWNNTFNSNMHLNEAKTHLFGSGDFESGRGCAVFGLFDYSGGHTRGSTAPKFVYKLSDYERTAGEFENTYFYSGASDVENEVCFGGFGFNQNSSFDEVDADNELGGEPKPAYGIQIVDFTVALNTINQTNDNNDPWTNSTRDAFANVYIYDLPDNPEDIYRVNNRLYVAANTFGGVQIIDASDPANLSLEGVIHTEDKAKGVAVNHDQTLAIIADDNIRGIVRAPLYFPVLDRVDNDAVTLAVDGDGNAVMTAEEIQVADMHAKAGEVLRYEVQGLASDDEVICYASEDVTPYGDESCVVEVVEGSTFVSWTLSSNTNDAGDVVDQQIRVAAGDNIQFLSTSAKVFID